MPTTITTDQIDTITLTATDTNGNPIALVPDAPPDWTNSDPSVASTSLSVDHLTNTVTPLTEGTTTIGVGLTVDGQAFSASTDEIVVATTPPPTGLHAIFSGSVNFNVAASDGVDAGDYIGEFVHQKCIRCVVPGTDFTVFFRRDADGTRPEIVVERGKIFDKSITPAQIQTPYQAQFYDGATLLATINVPAHWYFARWRWPNTPRPVVRNIATLLSRKWIPALTTSSGLNCTSDTKTPLNLYVNPMDTTGLYWDGSTGERPEIGLVTEQQADYIINGGSNAFLQMMANAEANATIPIHCRDEVTGAPLNVQVHPYMTLNNGQSSNSRFIDSGPLPIDPMTGKKDKRYRQPDQAHHPDCCGVPWMLTDDPYYLEEMQFTANFCVIQSSFFPSQMQLPGLVGLEQTRGWAWGKRGHFRCAKFSLASPPSWLLSQAVWQQNLADNLTYANRIMTSPAKAYTIYHTISKSGGLAIWQKGYDSYTLGRAILDLGFTEWRAHYDWHINCILDQYNGTSGWNAGDPMPYSVKLMTDGSDSAYIPDTSKDAVTVPSYAALWAQFKADNGFDDSGWDPALMYTNQSGPDYTIILYSALKTAADLSIPGAAALVTKLKAAWTQVKKWDGSANYNATTPKNNMKWSV